MEHRVVCAISFLLLALSACSPVSKGRLTRAMQDGERRFQDQTGFVLYDVSKARTVVDYHGDRYFTPASNTKIFTFYTALTVLGQRMPALRYRETPDSLIIWGTGDPSFLYNKVFSDTTAYHFLRTSRKPVYISFSNFNTTHFGAGWAWDDYLYNFSPERSPLPVYGNLMMAKPEANTLRITPRYFQPYLKTLPPAAEVRLERGVFGNDIRYQPDQQPRTKALEVPFHADASTVVALLSDTLKRPVVLTNKPLRQASTLYGISTDSLYRVMMQDSDNFIAEQLLMACAGVLSDTLQPEVAIRYMLSHELSDLPDKPEWVDGSGLSRYNLFTPRTLVALWRKIAAKVPRERLFPLLVTGGKGTLKNLYKTSPPSIYGKTGSLSNNHCLSGFLLTKSGKTLIFSFMNSNFAQPTSEIRQHMQDILLRIYEHY